ncbi:hypothetical protein AB0E88_32435 [Streptomyces sp. NPDC028635]|uniref:hypothetical protein n=1 Tax=Streptomyces sp. NPDC028635 TaxID=3154800 RepID=UPI0033D78988
MVATAVLGGVLAGCGTEGGADTPGKAGRSGAAPEQGTAAVRAAYDRTAEAGTAKLTVRVRATADGQTAASDGRGVVDLKDGDSALTVTAQGRPVEQRVVDRILYQKVPGARTPAGKPWVRVDLKRMAAQQGLGTQGIGDPARSTAFAKAVTDRGVTEAGRETVGGVATTRYRVTVDVAALPGGADLRRQLGPAVPMQLWLDDDGRIRRQQIETAVRTPIPASAPASGQSAAPQQLRIVTVLEYSDFGTDVDVEAPPAGQVTDLTGRAPQGGGTPHA